MLNTSNDKVTAFIPFVFASSKKIDNKKPNVQSKNRDSSVPQPGQTHKKSTSRRTEQLMFHRLPTGYTETDGTLISEKRNIQ